MTLCVFESFATSTSQKSLAQLFTVLRRCGNPFSADRLVEATNIAGASFVTFQSHQLFVQERGVWHEACLVVTPRWIIEHIGQLLEAGSSCTCDRLVQLAAS